MRVDDALRLAIGHHNAGRLDQAEALYGQILGAIPRHPAAGTLLARIRMARGRPADAKGLLATAIAADPEYAPAHAALGDLAASSDQVDRAIGPYRRALVLAPAMAGAWVTLGDAEQRAERLDQAIAAYRHARVLGPLRPAAENNFAQALLKRGDTIEALAVADAILARDPIDVRANAFRAVALRELGRRAEFDWLVGGESLIRPSRLPVPEGYPDIGTFNADLARDLRAHPNLVDSWDPMRRALRGGSAIPRLEAYRTKAIVAFEAALRRAILDYAEALPAAPSHPFLSRRPLPDFRLEIWGNILGDQHFQSTHIHNLGWMSGVYYVELPPAVDRDEAARAGWIEFHRPGYGIPDRGADEPPSIKPEEGLAVFFPSYVWHRTIPFTGGGARTSIAFDLYMATTI